MLTETWSTQNYEILMNSTDIHRYSTEAVDLPTTLSTGKRVVTHSERHGRSSLFGSDKDVLDVAETQQRIRTEFTPESQGAGEGVRGLDRGDDSLGGAQQPESIHGLRVGDGRVVGTTDVGQVRVLRADARVVEPGADRMRLDGLTVLVLEDVGTSAVQDAHRSSGDRGGVATRLDAVAARLVAGVNLPVWTDGQCGGSFADAVGEVSAIGALRRAGLMADRLPVGVQTQLEKLNSKFQQSGWYDEVTTGTPPHRTSVAVV